MFVEIESLLLDERMRDRVGKTIETGYKHIGRSTRVFGKDDAIRIRRRQHSERRL